MTRRRTLTADWPDHGHRLLPTGVGPTCWRCGKYDADVYCVPLGGYLCSLCFMATHHDEQGRPS